MKKVLFKKSNKSYELLDMPMLAYDRLQLSIPESAGLAEVYENAKEENSIEVYEDEKLISAFTEIGFFAISVINGVISLEFTTSDLKKIITGMKDSDKKEKAEINKQISTLENLLKKAQNTIEQLSVSQEMQAETLDSVLGIDGDEQPIESGD